MSPPKNIYQLDADGLRMYDNDGNYIKKGRRTSLLFPRVLWMDKASEQIAWMIVNPKRRYTRRDLDEVAETIKKILVEQKEEWG